MRWPPGLRFLPPRAMTATVIPWAGRPVSAMSTRSARYMMPTSAPIIRVSIVRHVHQQRRQQRVVQQVIMQPIIPQPDKVTSYSNSASFLTLFAPSNQAYTTDIVGSGGYSSGDYYTSFGGTSAACPYAAGSAAVLQQAAKAKTGAYLTPAQVKTYLVNNGDNVTDGKVAVTKPRINLGRAVDALPVS